LDSNNFLTAGNIQESGKINEKKYLRNEEESQGPNRTVSG